MFGLEWTKGTRWWRSWPVGPFRQEAAVAGHRHNSSRTSSILNFLSFGWVTCKETGKKQDTGIEGRGTGAHIEGRQSDLVLPTWRLKPARRTQFKGGPISVESYHPSYASPAKWQQWSSRNSWCAAEGHWEAALCARRITTRLLGAWRQTTWTEWDCLQFLFSSEGYIQCKTEMQGCELHNEPTSRRSRLHLTRSTEASEAEWSDDRIPLSSGAVTELEGLYHWKGLRIAEGSASRMRIIGLRSLYTVDYWTLHLADGPFCQENRGEGQH